MLALVRGHEDRAVRPIDYRQYWRPADQQRGKSQRGERVVSVTINGIVRVFSISK